jgi:hypothetical protein
MRWIVVLLVVVACKRGGEPSTTLRPSLDVAPDAAVGSAAPKPPPTETLGLQFEPIDGPPPSAPTGQPMQLKFVPAVVGAKRTRTHTHLALYHTRFLDDESERLQETQQTFVFREEMLVVGNNRVKKMGVQVDQATELIVLDGNRHEQVLLAGYYTIDVAGPLPRDMKISVAGRTMGTREQEELSGMLSMDAASATLFHELVWQHPLRIGEAVVLTDDEEKTLLGGDTAPADITFSLRKVDGGVATYQFDMKLDRDADTRMVRQRYVVKLATGQMLEVMDATISREKSEYMNKSNKVQTTIRFAW